MILMSKNKDLPSFYTHHSHEWWGCSMLKTDEYEKYNLRLLTLIYCVNDKLEENENIKLVIHITQKQVNTKI